jgi:hypothetical protein
MLSIVNEERIIVSSVQLNQNLQDLPCNLLVFYSASPHLSLIKLAAVAYCFMQTDAQRQEVQQAAVSNERDGCFIQAAVSTCHAHSTAHVPCDGKLNLNTG